MRRKLMGVASQKEVTPMECVRCESKHIAFNGRYPNTVQRYKCCDCRKQFSEATFREFYRHRLPVQIIRTAIFFHLFVPANTVKIFIFFLFRCYVSKKTICSWSRKFLDNLPEISCNEKYKSLIRHTDEKQIKIKGKKAWWWNIVNYRGQLLTTLISWTRTIYAAKKLMKENKNNYGSPLIMITDKLQVYPKSIHIFGRNCRHITAGLVPRLANYKKDLLLVSNLAVERMHSKIDTYIQMKVRGSFESFESASRHRKAFMLTTYLQETLALQRSLATFSIALNKHTTLRELAVPV